MNKKIISVAAIATIGMAGVASTFANSGTVTSHEKVPGFAPFHQFGPKMMNLTDTEKTQLESMSEEQKKSFFEQKMTAEKTKMDAQEQVIDKLLAGTQLTSDEETIRQQIITDRAARKTEMANRQAEMQKMKTIFDKQKAGTALTAEEQAALDAMPKPGNFAKK